MERMERLSPIHGHRQVPPVWLSGAACLVVWHSHNLAIARAPVLDRFNLSRYQGCDLRSNSNFVFTQAPLTHPFRSIRCRIVGTRDSSPLSRGRSPLLNEIMTFLSFLSVFVRIIEFAHSHGKPSWYHADCMMSG